MTMEEEFDKWLEDIRPLKDLNDAEVDIAKLAFYRAYEAGYDKCWNHDRQDY
jgi:hypothetical protein